MVMSLFSGFWNEDPPNSVAMAKGYICHYRDKCISIIITSSKTPVLFVHQVTNTLFVHQVTNTLFVLAAIEVF